MYDRRGRLIRSVTTAESRWTEQDRAEAIALAVWRDSFCPCGCGNKRDQTLVPEGVGPEWAVHETACTARYALLEEQNAVPESRQKYLQASLWSVQPRKR